MKKLLREPLVHFLIAGAVLFLVMGRFGGADSSDRSITIDAAQVASLATQWGQTWHRPPSPQELDGLIRDHIKEEIYFREAMRLGLDADDPIIRRRLRTKMEFLATAEAENTPPTDAELTRYYRANKPRYAADPAFSFEQQYFGDDQASAANAVAALGAGKAVAAVSLDVPAAMQAAASDQISRQFGDDFAQSLRDLPLGRWGGPVRSGFGWHAVRVRDVTASKIPPLAEIRQRVTNDWRAQTRATREAAAYQALLDGYDIRIAKP
jgi:peptidyl-prolyl cis-trans isomerase C